MFKELFTEGKTFKRKAGEFTSNSPTKAGADAWKNYVDGILKAKEFYDKGKLKNAANKYKMAKTYIFTINTAIPSEIKEMADMLNKELDV